MSVRTLPPSRVCSQCGHDDDLERFKLAPGLFQFRCSASRHGNQPYEWTVDLNGSELPAWEGVLDELGLYNDLPLCVTEADGWVEYGIVEYRYAHQFPDHFRAVTERHKHREQQEGLPYSASMLIAAALSRLERRGVLAKAFHEATGYWRYDGEISYWAALPAPPAGEQVQTWVAFAPTVGVKPAQSGLQDVL